MAIIYIKIKLSIKGKRALDLRDYQSGQTDNAPTKVEMVGGLKAPQSVIYSQWLHWWFNLWEIARLYPLPAFITALHYHFQSLALTH